MQREISRYANQSSHFKEMFGLRTNRWPWCAFVSGYIMHELFLQKHKVASISHVLFTTWVFYYIMLHLVLQSATFFDHDPVKIPGFEPQHTRSVYPPLALKCYGWGFVRLLWSRNVYSVDCIDLRVMKFMKHFKYLVHHTKYILWYSGIWNGYCWYTLKTCWSVECEMCSSVASITHSSVLSWMAPGNQTACRRMSSLSRGCHRLLPKWRMGKKSLPEFSLPFKLVLL